MSTLFASMLNSPVMLSNYLQHTTSADDIFRCIFLGALRVNNTNNVRAASTEDLYQYVYWPILIIVFAVFIWLDEGPRYQCVDNEDQFRMGDALSDL